MTTPLFEDPTMYEDDRRQGVLRQFALGGVLQILRAGKGWSVEQAAVHAGLGHMTWRRMEDGFSVRNKTYAAVDALFELPFGTTKRALADNGLMLDLIGQVAPDAPANPTTAHAEQFIAQFATQTLSKAGKQTAKARATASMPSMTEGPLPRAADMRVIASQARMPVSDLEAVAAVLDRITHRHLTPKLEAAVRALLDAMPDLIGQSVNDDRHSVPTDDGVMQR